MTIVDLIALFGIAIGEACIAGLTARVLDLGAHRTRSTVISALVIIPAGMLWPILLAMRESAAIVAWLVWTVGVFAFARIFYQGRLHRMRAWLLFDIYVLMVLAGILVAQLFLMAHFV